MEEKILESVGSDASYDLILEAVYPRPPQGVIIIALDSTYEEKSQMIIKKLFKHFQLDDQSWGIKVNLFQRMPDAWVWKARMQVLIDKMNNKGDKK